MWVRLFPSRWLQPARRTMASSGSTGPASEGPPAPRQAEALLALSHAALPHPLAAASVLPAGPWMDGCRYFNTIFLNWNPSLFSYRSITHATWPLAQGPRNDSYNLGSNPQYTLCIEDRAATSAGTSSTHAHDGRRRRHRG